jgi:hypothetical protein
MSLVEPAARIYLLMCTLVIHLAPARTLIEFYIWLNLLQGDEALPGAFG